MNYILAAASGSSAGGAMGSTILMVVAFIAIFYFLMIRPEGKKKKEAEAMRSSVKVNDEITTIGGIIGTVCAVKEDSIVIETGADRVRLEMKKWAISTNDTAEAARKEAAAAKKKTKKGE